ncbi:MAG: DNA mismatch repair endonuclease MutL [Sodaliphilus sp.]|nr:DNA mismatch repair endonuclease MutL [Bacteroidales bacterium]MDY2591520.1 DNA mismatch repair endonuclease MutL [Sodaliphilus sp.]MCI6657841.1 DNA mismatch repair endonuclease MutL [Bacteroidales bacterium]MCI6903556.1 DNA mismatch repair endonuclease MutL [Bacteroidales bacterium]MCI6933206.1 DNA mismatch repair endonuclease MutL [Bacteroidales bacterium]
MSDIIKLLPDSVANQIAAGEVIQRPASVIKELVENAIDAGATSIQIVLKDAGRTLIQVIDNGKGMSDTDARLAFERHSTSKISKAEDLFSLQTMGFRGEALASIAAIAQVELRTRAKGAQLGTKIMINASKCESQEPDMCPEGSNFMIKNIFFNVPARRKFLKSNQVELSNIIKEYEKLALVNHHVDFSLSNNDKLLNKFSGGSFKQRIASLWGAKVDQQLVPLNTDTSLVRITGFVSKPEGARKRNFLQFLFVNGRFMRHPYFHKAIISSYSELIPDDEQPNYFLNFSVDPESIDVNIHPTKTEIKFENELPIWQILAAAVKESLGRFSAVPQIDFDTIDAPEIPAFNDHTVVTAPEDGIDPTYNPFKPQSKSSAGGGSSYHPQSAGNFGGYSSNPLPDWEKLYQNFEKGKQEGIASITEQDVEDSFSDIGEVEPVNNGVQAEIITPDMSSAMCMQMKGRYILSPIKSGLMIVDQHRAHVRVLFEQYIKQLDATTISSQRVLFPEVLQLTTSQNIILKELEPEMEKIGFNLAQLSGNDWSINAVPAGMENVNIKDTILQVIDEVSMGGTSITTKVYESIALRVAKSAAIPYGKTMLQEEMDTLLSKLLCLPNPNYTPDGKTIISVLSNDQLEKMF